MQATVAWFEDARDVDYDTMATAYAAKVGAHKADVNVVRHYPEQYLVRFMYPHHCADAVNRGDFQCWNSMIFIRAWRLEAHADNKAMMHHVRLCIEGIPVHSRNTYIDTFFIGPGCSLDYIEQRSLRREDTCDLALWAWTADPSCIPKVKWLTHPACGHHRRGCRGLRHRVLLHLDLHKDHSKARDDDNPPPPDIYEDTWVRKMVHDMFKYEMSPDIVAAMCALVKIDHGLENKVEESLLAHGSTGALDRAEDHDGAAAA
ncbi:hypothetical protein D1007_49653 [Hordeum vulgare]|nr:hypothetical protein D1007_49653 [Hordeum vulgare]